MYVQACRALERAHTYSKARHTAAHESIRVMHLILFDLNGNFWWCWVSGRGFRSRSSILHAYVYTFYKLHNADHVHAEQERHHQPH